MIASPELHWEYPGVGFSSTGFSGAGISQELLVGRPWAEGSDSSDCRAEAKACPLTGVWG